MNPELIDPHWDMRGCPNWHEYARVTRNIHVEARKAGIGTLFHAYLPDGYVHVTSDLEYLTTILPVIECKRLEIVGAP